MLFIYDFSVVGIFKGIFTVLLFNLKFKLAYKFILYILVAKDIIRGNTGLSAVKIFSKNNSLCSKLYFSRRIHYARALPSKLQHCRGKMLTAFSKHLFTYRLTSCEKYHIKFFIQKLGIFLPTSTYNTNILRREALLYNFLNNFACLR